MVGNVDKWLCVCLVYGCACWRGVGPGFLCTKHNDLLHVSGKWNKDGSVICRLLTEVCFLDW